MNNSRAPIRLALLAGAALLAVGAAHAADPAPAKSTDNAVVATVNGTALTTRDLAALSRTLAPQGQTLSREEALQALVDRELLYQEAVAKGYDKLPNVVSELDIQKRALLSNVAVSEAMRGKQPADAVMRKIYQDKVATKNVKEFKARHILVPTEAAAKDVIAQLDKGANFSDLAKTKSRGRAAAQSAGQRGGGSAG